MLALLFLVTETFAFTGKAIFSNPSTVQTPNVNIEFYAVPETTINAQGTIQLTAPNQITVRQPSACFDVLNKLPCIVALQSKTFTITTSSKLVQAQQFQFRLSNAIDNPISTQPTNSWSLLTSSGESLQSDMLLTATPGISSLTLQPVSTVVGASTNIVLKWTGSHAVPQGSLFQFTFPVWNPNSPQLVQQLPFFQGGVICSPLVVLSSKLTCQFTNNTLTLYSGVSSDIGSSTDLSIMVTGFKNPMDTSLIQGFTVSSIYQNYLIDVGQGVLQVSDYAQITGGKLEVRYPDAKNAGQIQTTEDMKLSFFLPVPLNQGCQVTVVLPQQYNVTSVTAVSSLQLFGSYTQYTASNLQISQKNNSFTFYPCDSYKTNQNQAVIYISQLTQYKYEMLTDSVQVYITNAGFKICQVQSGVSFLPSRGVANVSAIAQNPQIAKPTSLAFSLQPQHRIFAADAPTIMITFPTTVTGCSVSIGSCVRDQQNSNLVTIRNAITKDYKPGDQAINVTFTSVMNPSTTKPMEQFDLQILAQGKYVIDESVGSTPWLLQPGNITSVQVNPGSYQAFQPNNNYIIQFTPNDYLPLNAYFEIQFPNEVLVPDLSYSASACSANQGLTVTCQFLNSTKLVLRVLNAFRIIPGQAGTTYSLTIPGVQNPIRTTPTGPFVIKTSTYDDYVIDQFVGANIQMLIEAQIQKVSILPSNYINSKPTTLQITITPSVPVTKSNLLLLTLPVQMQLPSSDLSYNCSTTYTNLIQQVTCKTYSPTTVMISFVFVGQGVAGSDTFGFSISGISNPPSTQTTDSLQFKIVDQLTFATTNQMLFGVTITTSQPWPIANASVSLNTYQPGVPAVYTFQFVPEHTINTGGGILITVPPQINFDGQIVIVVTVQNQVTDQQLIYSQVTQSARQILIQNAIQSTTKDVITVKVQGLNTPFSNQPTDSFQIRTFNQVNGLFYFIDAALQGLQITALCSYPCNTCQPNQPSVCTSCFQQTSGIGLPFLQLGTCVSECNFGRYYNTDSQQCDLCDPSCLTCVNKATQCTTCGNNQSPYYYNQKCLQSCPAGFLPNLQAYKCQQCASNCGSCSKTITTCTSCNQTSNYTLLYNNQCVQQCPALISVQVGSTCVPCNPACKTCGGDPNTCITCPSHKKYDPVGFTCLEQCKPQTQIYNPDLETCDQCNQTCSKCDGDINKCTECKPGYVLNKDFTCQATCNDENLSVHQTGVNGVCMDCEQPCNTCSKKTNFCTSCLQTPVKFYWYQQSQCVQYCPNKYNVTADGLACFYVGLKCPDYFKLDATGDGCVPEQVECISGYELNDQRTACIPLPGSPVPFPFLIAAVFVSFLVLGSYIKEKFYTKVYTCLIAIIGSFELIMYLLIVAFSYHMQEYAIAGLASVGAIALITSNILFVVYYQRDILAIDTTFSKWLFFFPKTKGLIVPCCLINFKCAKILYSGFYGMESSMARFERPLEFYRIVKMVTYFAYIFAYIFIFLADFVIFAKIKWGYQLLVLGIETFILQIVIIILTFLEWKKEPEQLLSVGSTQYTTIKPKGGKEVNVKSAVEDSEDDDYELGIPDVDELVLIRSKEKHHQVEVQLRMLAFVNLIKNANTHQADLAKVQSKFDEELLSRRRAFSLTQVDTDVWASESCSSVLQSRRRYSWPLTLQQPAEEEIAKFEVQIKDIEKADNEYLLDNCYFDTRPPQSPVQEQKPKRFACRRTQTYLRELLQIEGYGQNDSLQSIIMDDDAEIDDDYCKGLIDNVLSHVSGNEAQSDFEDPLHQSFHFMDAEFDLAQLMGDFETDDLGNFIIVKKAGTNILLDRQGRRVNRRGYLIDAKGNVINLKGHVIFKQYELDQDDELPIKFDQAILHNREKMQIQGESAPVEVELNSYQETDREILKIDSKSSLEVISHDDKIDQVMQEVTTEKILRKQSQMKRPSHQIANNYPPKRFGHQYSGPLYPFIEIDNEEQRRLAILTSQIGMQAQSMQKVNLGEPDLRQRVQQQKHQTLTELMSERQRASSVHDLTTKRPLTASRKARPPIDRNNLQKIYSNIDQLVGLDEPQLNQLQESRPDTKRKSIQDSQRLAAVESIYLNRSANRAVTAKGARPQRPTLLQFQDDPVELNVDTKMNGSKFNGQQARDVSLLMAERVDQIQRNYMKQMQSQDNLSEYKLVITDRQKPNSAVRHDNWLQ